MASRVGQFSDEPSRRLRGGALYLASASTRVARGQPLGFGTGRRAAVVDGTVFIAGLVHGLRAQGLGRTRHNILAPGARYDVYTAARRYMVWGRWRRSSSLPARRIGISATRPARSHRDRTRWPHLRAALTSELLTRDRDEWAASSMRDA